MDILSYIGDIFTIANLTGVIIGTIVGVILGALPGCTPSLGLAIFIPITYTMDFTTAMIYLGSIFVGGMYGGAITAILINVPGTAAAAACTIEGYKMTLHGRAKEALIESTTSNFVGSIFGILVLLFMAPKLAKMAFEFGPQENFMLAIFGLSVIASLSTKNMMKGIISGLFGLLLACVGMDPVYGLNRLTLGIHQLANGISLVPAVIGLFAFAMVIGTLSAKKRGNNTDGLKNVQIDHHTNVQALIDEGVDLEDAISKIILSRAFDNDIICAAEQSVHVPAKDYDKALEIFGRLAYLLPEEKDAALKDTLFPGSKMNKKMVGRTAQEIGAACGLEIPKDKRVIAVRAKDMEDIWGDEKMFPVVAIYPYNTWEDGVRNAQTNLNKIGRGHSVVVHSNDEAHILYAGEHCQVSRVVCNQPCATTAGGSFQNGLNPTNTLGCGSWGNNSISENLTYYHMMNITRIAKWLKDKPIPTDEAIWE